MVEELSYSYGRQRVAYIGRRMLVVVIRAHHGVDIMLFEFGLKHFLVMRNDQFDDRVSKFNIVNGGDGFYLWPKQRRTEANAEIDGCHQILFILLRYSEEIGQGQMTVDFARQLLAYLFRCAMRMFKRS